MRRATVFVGILIFFSIIYSLQYKNIPISYYDEHDWIAKSYQAGYYGIKSDIWDSYQAYDQPPLVGYVYNLFIKGTYLKNRLRGESYKDYLFRNNFLLFEGDKTPIPWGKVPEQVSHVSINRLEQMFGLEIRKTINIIFVVRKYNAILWAINIAIVFLITQALSVGVIIGVIITILLGFNSLLSQYGLMAQSESIFLTLFNINILLFLILRHKKNLIWTSLLALFAALLFQTKINGIMIYIFILMYFIWQKKWEKIAIYAISFIFSSILLNPTLMHWDFLWRIYHYLEVRRAVQAGQIRDYPISYIQNVWQAFLLFFNHFFFETWQNHYNIALPNSLMYVFLFICWLVGIVKQWKKRPIFVIFFIWIFFITTLYLRLDWNRYWIHLTFFVYYFEIYGLFSIGQLIYKRVIAYLGRIR